MSIFAKTSWALKSSLLWSCLLWCMPVQATDVTHRGYFEGRYQYFFGFDPELETFLQSIDPGFSDRGYHPEQPHGGIFRTRSILDLGFSETQSVNLAAQAYWSLGFFERSQNAFGEVASLERASYTTSGAQYDLTLGKQALTWGSGLLLNPTDLFFQSAPGDPWQERPGVWSIRHVQDISEESSLTTVLALDDDCCKTVGIARFEWTMDTWDLATQAGWRQEHNEVSIGVDVKGDVEVGVWLEAMVTYGVDLDHWQFDGELGVDYTFDLLNGLYLAVEWLHSGAGVEEDYLMSLLGGKMNERSVFLGLDYAVALARLTFSSDWAFSLVSVNNVRDPSGSLVGQLTWMVSGWIEFIVGGAWSYGDSESEYGLSFSDANMVGPGLLGSRLAPEAFLSSWVRIYY
jgi:hypothetical protein